MATFFLSYAADSDLELAKALTAKLRGRRHVVFFDKDSLATGSDFDARIRAEIFRCDIFIVLLRESAIADGTYVRTELRIAEERWPSPVGRICPVELEPIESRRLPYPLLSATKLTPKGNVETDVADTAEKMARDLDPHVDDWVKLTKVSDEACKALDGQARRQWGPLRLDPIERELLSVIERELDVASLILTGAAGDGKSSLLAALYRRLEGRGSRVALLRLDDVTSPTLDGIKEDLGLTTRLETIINETVGAPPYFLLVDALETSEADRERSWKKIIGAAAKDPARWRVIVAIRLVTLETAGTWKEMFDGQPIVPSGSSATARVRHIMVPPFADLEMERLLAPAAGAWSVIKSASRKVRELLATPFNLRMLMETSAPDRFVVEGLRSHRVLLDRYWQKRVLDAPHGLDRKQLLEELVLAGAQRQDAMLVNGSQLRRAALDGLVQDGVLRRAYGSGNIAFAHDLIEDYVKALRLDAVPHAIDAFRARPELRQGADMTVIHYTAASIQLWLDGLWLDPARRERFWEVVMELGRPTTNPHAKATFAQCVVDFATMPGDLRPLVEPALVAGAAGSDALDSLLYVLEHACATVARLEIAPWLEVCEWLTASRSGPALVGGTRLLNAVLERPDLGALRARAGACARSLLAATWTAQEPRAAQLAFGAVISTIGTAVTESVQHLSRAVNEHALCARHEQLQVLAWKAKDVLASGGPEGAELIASLYASVGQAIGKAAREHDEATNQWLARAYEDGADQVGPVPTRTHTELSDVATTLSRAELISRFIRAAPSLASRTIARGLREFELERPRNRILTLHSRAVHVQARHDWPRTAEGLEAGLTDTLCDELTRQASDAPAVARAMVDALADAEAPIDLWQAIVERSAFSLPLLDQISDLFGSPDAVRLMSQAMASVITQHGTALPKPVRASLERVLEGLGDEGIDAYVRDRIESALRGDVSPASEGDAELLATEPTTAPDDNAPSRVEREYLRLLGMSDADIDAAANRTLRRAALAAQRAATELGRDPSGKVPIAEPPAIEVGRLRLGSLLDALGDSGIHGIEAARAWGVAGELASGLARQGVPDTSVVETLFALLERQPFRAAGTDNLLNRYRDEGFVTCIDGLVALASRGDARAIDAVNRAATDDEPAKRYHVADRIHELAELPADAGWKLVERLVRDEHPEVVTATTTSFGPFYKLDRDRALALDDAALRSTRGKAAYQGQVHALTHLAWFELNSGDATAKRYLRDALQDEALLEGPVGQLMHAYREWLVLGGTEDGAPSDEQRAKTDRAWALFDDIVRRGLEVLATPPPRAPAGAGRDERTPGAQVLEDAAYQLYFASGAFDHDPALTASGRSRYWSSAQPLLLALGTSTALPAAERVLEVLAHLLGKRGEVPQEAVFDSFLRIAASAVDHGYARAWGAIDLVDRVLRSEQASLRGPTARAMATKIVDAFLEAKWQKAYLLARDLDLSDLGPRLQR